MVPNATLVVYLTGKDSPTTEGGHTLFDDANVTIAPTQGAVLAFQNVSFSYSGKKADHLYEGLEFGIDCDSRIALVGPNGAGKSTLLKLMAQELLPTEGDMRRKSLVWMVVVLLLNALAIFGVVMLGVRFEVTLAVVTFISSFPTFVIPAAGVCMPHLDAKGRGKADTGRTSDTVTYKGD